MKVPFAVGVPERSPEAAKVRPGGKVPEAIANVYGGVPPLAANVTEYDVFTVAFGSDAGVMAIAGQPLLPVNVKRLESPPGGVQPTMFARTNHVYVVAEATAMVETQLVPPLPVEQATLKGPLVPCPSMTSYPETGHDAAVQVNVGLLPAGCVVLLAGEMGVGRFATGGHCA